MSVEGECGAESSSEFFKENIIRQYPGAKFRFNDTSKGNMDNVNIMENTNLTEKEVMQMECPSIEPTSQRRKRQDEDFQKDNKRHTAKISRILKESVLQNIIVNTENRFQPLTKCDTPSVQHTITAVASNQPSTSTSQTSTSAPIMSAGIKQQKPKPIILISKVQYFRLQEVFKQFVSTMPVCQFCPKGLKIQPSSEEDGQKIMTYFKDQKMEFYTFVSRQYKTIKVVMRGLPIDTPTEDIERQLQDLKYPVESVKQMKRKVENYQTGAREWQIMPLWLVTVYDVQNAPEIRKLTGLYNLKVTFSEYISQGGPLQCFNCQGFGHKATGCFVTSKCVKCGKNHSTKDCKKEPTEAPNCANCKEQHPANYRQCTKFLAYANGRNSHASQSRKQGMAPLNNQSEFPNLPSRMNSSPFGQTTNSVPQQNENMGSIFSELKDMLQFVKKLMNNFRSVFSEMKKEKDPLNRLIILADSLCTAFNYDN